MKSDKKTMKERIRERAKNNEGRGQGGLDCYTLPEKRQVLEIEKKMRLDVIPYRVSVTHNPEAEKGEQWYHRVYLMHRNVGPDRKRVVCLRTFGKKCPICQEYRKLSSDEDADKDLVKSLRPKERELFNVINRDEPKKGIQLLDMAPFCFGQKLEEEVREGEEDVAGFPYLKGGKTLVLRFTEESFDGNDFWKISKIDFVDRPNLGKDILDDAIDLDAILKRMSYEALDKLFHDGTEDEDDEDDEDDDSDDRDEGTTGEDDDDDDDEDEPKKSKKSKSKKSKKTDDDDDDDSDGDDDVDDDDDGEDEDDEKPRKKKARKSDDDDDDSDGDEDDDDPDDDAGSSDDDDDEDEEDNIPLPKGKKKSKKSKKSKDDDEDEEDDDEEDDD